IGAQAKQPAVQFASAGSQVVRADVEQEFAARIAVGQTARIEEETSSGRAWHGEVERIADWITRRRSVMHEPLEYNDVRTIEVLIALEPDQAPLRIGQRVRVRIGE
ncbi:MAG: HlyD family secretion protein, partial [Gemmataceae bacterium]